MTEGSSIEKVGEVLEATPDFLYGNFLQPWIPEYS